MRALVAVLVVLGLATAASAEVLCRTKKGRVFVRAACAARETSIALPQGAPGAAGPAAAPPIRVVDAAGLQIGLFAEPGRTDGITVVVVEVGTTLAWFFAGESGFSPTAVYHLTTDCSDAPLAFAGTPRLVRRGTVLGVKAWYPGDPVTTQAPLASQRPRSGADCGTDTPLANGNCCSTVVPGPIPLGLAVEAFSPTTFTPPFRLEP
jgi:hypothetical protein